MNSTTTKPAEEVNGLNLEVLQTTVAEIKRNPALARCKFRARNRWVQGAHNCSAVSDFYGAGQENRHQHPFELHADEPPILAGQDEAPNPVEHLLHALASCVTTSLVAHAAVRGIHIEELESELEGDIDMRGFFGLSNDVPKGFTDIRLKFKVKTDQAGTGQLRQLADFSPVYNTLTRGTKVDIQIEPKP